MAWSRISWWRASRWRHGQGLLFTALLVAISGLACVLTMVERVEHTLARESRAMLGADLVVASNKDLLEAGALDSMTAVLPADTQYARTGHHHDGALGANGAPGAVGNPAVGLSLCRCVAMRR